MQYDASNPMHREAWERAREKAREEYMDAHNPEDITLSGSMFENADMDIILTFEDKDGREYEEEVTVNARDAISYPSDLFTDDYLRDCVDMDHVMDELADNHAAEWAYEHFHEFLEDPATAALREQADAYSEYAGRVKHLAVALADLRRDAEYEDLASERLAESIASLLSLLVTTYEAARDRTYAEIDRRSKEGSE